MKIVIEPKRLRLRPNKTVYRIYTNGWGLGVDLKSYDAAVKVANAISDGAIDKVVTIDYSACLKGN